MKLSSKAENIYAQINDKTTKLGDLRKIAKDIKKDHSLATELWSNGEYLPRQTGDHYHGCKASLAGLSISLTTTYSNTPVKSGFN